MKMIYGLYSILIHLTFLLGKFTQVIVWLKLVIVPKETTLNPKDFLDLLVQEKVTILTRPLHIFIK